MNSGTKLRQGRPQFLLWTVDAGGLQKYDDILYDYEFLATPECCIVYTTLEPRPSPVDVAGRRSIAIMQRGWT